MTRTVLPYGTWPSPVTPATLTAGAVKVAVHRFRQRYRECLLSALRDTLAEGEDPEEELRYLLSLFSR